MKKMIIIIIIIFLLPLLYFRNIIFAFLLSSERFDKHMLPIMLQGSLSPSKTIILKDYVILLPDKAGRINETDYIIPKTSWEKYQDKLIELNWTKIEQNGTQVRIHDTEGKEFYISIKPYTGFFLILSYYTL